MMEFVFSLFKLSIFNSFNDIFKYLANILQHSFQRASLDGYFHEDSENKTANVFSLILVGFYCSYGDISVNAL